MNNIHKKFAKTIGTQWIKVKFYFEKNEFKDAQYLRDVRFCEAAAKSLLHPVVVDSQNIICPGARYVFGWQDKKDLVSHCLKRTQMSKDNIYSLVQQMPRFQKTIKSIGLNTEDEPDLIISRVTPKDVMNLISLYHIKTGQCLDVSTCSIMSICGGIAGKTFLNETISLSFGCVDSRKFAQLERDRLVIGIPKRHFNLVDII